MKINQEQGTSVCSLQGSKHDVVQGTLKSAFHFSCLSSDVISSRPVQVMLKSLCIFAKLFPETLQETFWVLGVQIPPLHFCPSVHLSFPFNTFSCQHSLCSWSRKGRRAVGAY